MEKYTGAPVESAGMECKRGMTKGYTKVFFWKKEAWRETKKTIDTGSQLDAWIYFTDRLV